MQQQVQSATRAFSGRSGLMCRPDDITAATAILFQAPSAVPANSAAADEWDAHWQHQRASIFGALCSWYRRNVRAYSVAHYVEKRFPASGVFAECGSGSSETSCRINSRQRKLIAVDFSREALNRAARIPQIAECVQADIRQLPFDNNSLDGIWNLGVMEHFEEAAQFQVLSEFHRVLKPGGQMLLWWPPHHGLDRTLLGWIGWPFPSEPGRVYAAQARDRIMKCGFTEVTIDFPMCDLWTELVISARA